MHQWILAAITALFSGPSATPTITVAVPAMAPVVAAQQPALQLAMLERVAEKPYDKAPVSAGQASAARGAVRHEKRSRGNGGRHHRFTFSDGTVVEFNDRPKRRRDTARRSFVVAFAGTETSSKEPDATFEAAGREAGLSPAAVSALRYISRHEGGFDAINTWDTARFSWGFIQFAGGYGLRPALAHFKQSSPALFQSLLADYGVDVLPGDDGNPEPVYVSPRTGSVLRGRAAEQAYGDDPLVIALFIRAGRVPEVKQRQVEAAIRDYAAPALTADLDDVKLSDVLRSPQALAMLIDRNVHEGHVARIRWALEHARSLARVANPADLSRLEGQVLDLAVQDADARANIVELVREASASLSRAASAARSGNAGYVADGPSLTAARNALQTALNESLHRMVTSERRDRLSSGFTALLSATDPLRVRSLSPREMAAELRRAAGRVGGLVDGMRYEYAIRNRLQAIRASELPGPGQS